LASISLAEAARADEGDKAKIVAPNASEKNVLLARRREGFMTSSFDRS
jgi:hypothetical protein